jgi:hypothetical protein
MISQRRGTFVTTESRIVVINVLYSTPFSPFLSIIPRLASIESAMPRFADGIDGDHFGYVDLGRHSPAGRQVATLRSSRTPVQACAAWTDFSAVLRCRSISLAHAARTLLDSFVTNGLSGWNHDTKPDGVSAGPGTRDVEVAVRQSTGAVGGSWR